MPSSYTGEEMRIRVFRTLHNDWINHFEILEIMIYLSNVTFR